MHYQEILTQARQLTQPEQEQLARELAPRPRAPRALGMLSPAPQSVAWLKAERGHAVLATDTGPADAEIPAGPDAIAGMWADRAGGQP